MALAVYGKHPAKGDFLDHGLPAALRPVLEGWLDTVLAQARADLGTEWERVWQAAPPLRFWLGEGIWGQAVCGVMVATQDRVGRRFPLVVLAYGADAAAQPPPVVDADPGWYDTVAAHLARMLRLTDLPGPAALLAGLGAPVSSAFPGPGPAEFWATRPGASVTELLIDLALTDHRRAAAHRSYWWVAGEEPAAQDAPADVAAEPDVPPPAVEAEPAVGDPPDTEPSPWDIPEEASPFAALSGPSLFAAPLPPDPGAPALVAAPVAPPTAPRGALWSQVWAGEGLPPGAVLAWFLRGVDGND